MKLGCLITGLWQGLLNAMQQAKACPEHNARRHQNFIPGRHSAGLQESGTSCRNWPHSKPGLTASETLSPNGCLRSDYLRKQLLKHEHKACRRWGRPVCAPALMQSRHSGGRWRTRCPSIDVKAVPPPPRSTPWARWPGRYPAGCSRRYAAAHGAEIGRCGQRRPQAQHHNIAHEYVVQGKNAQPHQGLSGPCPSALERVDDLRLGRVRRGFCDSSR